jgi:hypothetical protein
MFFYRFDLRLIVLCWPIFKERFWGEYLGDLRPLTSLCRLYEIARRFVSNSYAATRTFGPAQQTEEGAMGVIPADKELSAESGAGEPQTFWRRITQALDGFVAQRSRRSIPKMALRQSKYAHDRCRRLMLEGSLAPAAVEPNRGQARRAGRANRE